MRLIIEIDMKGAAFDENTGPNAIKAISNATFGVFMSESRRELIGTDIQIRDINGNICGSVRVEE